MQPIDLSIFTPTHRPKGLIETFQTLLNQDEKDWEWVIVPNNTHDRVPDEISKDPRVRIIYGAEGLENVGALKRFACDHCRGQYFVELDHDDLLAPNTALTHIKEAARRGGQFIYSDDAYFQPKEPYRAHNGFPRWGSYTFNPQHGWESYAVEFYGNVLRATKPFPITPRSLCEIYYAPDHVRCWERGLYYDCGGHNPSLKVCDDQELMIKAYLAGAQFEHTGYCDYLYRYYPENTVNRYQEDIVKNCKELKKKYIPGLIQESVRRAGARRISGDLTAGQIAAAAKDGDFGHIHVEHSLEYMDAEEVYEFFETAYNRLTAGGILTVIVPDATTAAGYLDPRFKTQFSELSMAPFTSSKLRPRHRFEVSCRFRQFSCQRQPLKVGEGTGDYLRFDLTAVNGPRIPGEDGYC